MEIPNSIIVKDQTNEIDIINKNKLYLTVLNNLTCLITFLLISWITINKLQDNIHGFAIIIQCFILGYLYYVQYRRKRISKQQQPQINQKLRQKNILIQFHNYLLNSNNFEFLFLSITSTIYISTFELIIHPHLTIQQIIILSLFLSLFLNIHLKGFKKGNLSFGYISLLQLYTILRIYFFYDIMPLDLILNILLLIYQISYHKTFETSQKKNKMSQKNKKIKTDFTMKLYQSILSIIPEGLAVINSDKKLLYANPTLKKILQSTQKNDILQILMNLGNNNSKISSPKASPYTKVGIESKDKKNPQSQEMTSIHKQKSKTNILIKPEKVGLNQNQVDNSKISHNIENSEDKYQNKQNQQSSLNQIQIQKIDQAKTNLNALCSLENVQELAQRSFGQVEEDNKKVNPNKQQVTSLHQLHLNKNENNDKFSNTKLNQNNFEENKQSSNKIYPQKQIMNSCNQFHSSNSVNSSFGKIQQSKLRDSRLDYSQKMRTVVQIRESAKNVMSQSNWCPSDNSEILSYQGFGFNIDDDQINQMPITPYMRQQLKRKSENYSIRGSIDQNSVFSLSQKQLQNQRSPGSKKNTFTGASGFQIRQNQKKMSYFQKPLEELPECQQISQESERNYVNPSVYVKCQSENEQNYTENSQYQSPQPNLLTSKKIKSLSSKMSKKNISMKDNQQNQSKQQFCSNVNVTSNLISSKKDQFSSQAFTLKLKTRKYVTQTNIDSKIVMKKTDVSDILNTIFQNQSGKKIDNEQNQVTIQDEGFQKNENEQNADDNLKDQHADNSNNRQKKRQSFISQLHKEEKDLTYLQQKDNIIKIQVKYKNKDLVLQFLSVDVLTDKSNNDPLVLVMVQDMWQDLYQKKVQDLQKDKMRIFASLSHELRTPLNCSISMLEVLRDEISEKNPSYIDEYLNPALFSNKLLLNQINDILDFVQMDSGKFKYSFFDFNIQNLLKDCQKLISMQAQMKNIEIQIIIEQDVPDVIRSDPNRIRQIILNFLSNSLKFTKSGYIKIGVQRISNHIYKLFVKDSGIGITEENLQTIFQFCGKVKYEKQDEGLNNQGCGLGLTISNSIAKGLVNDETEGGGISVESVYGKGSIFSILLQDMNQINKDDPKQDFKKQMSSISAQKKRKRQSLKEEENQIFKFINESQASINRSINSFILTPTKQSNKKQNHLIKPSQVIFEDDHSFAESQNNSIEPIKVGNKKSTFIKSQREKSDSEDILYENRRFVYPIQNSDRNIQDSTMIIEEENESNKRMFAQPEFLIQHHFNRFQEEDFIIKSPEIKKKKRSPSTHSNRSYTKVYEQISQLSWDVKVRKSDLYNNFADSPSGKPLDSSGFGFQDDFQIVSAPSLDPPKSKVVNSSLTNTKKYRSINSFKTQNTEQIEKLTQSYQEQEGFTSYNGGYNKNIETFQPLSSKIIIQSFTALERSLPVKSQNYLSQQYFQQVQIDYNQQDEQVIKSKDLESYAHINPQNIINEIIKQNNIKKLKCKCPQIIIVDDNQFNLYALGKTVQQFQFSCQQISDSVQAVEDLKDMYFNQCCIAPKIIFMDIEMPIKNGYEVASEINQFYESIQLRDTPVIIACTAYVGQEDREKAISSGMDDYINKPILKNAFQQLILNWSNLFL